MDNLYRSMRRAPVNVVLACGCTVKARATPLTPHVTYGCTSGLSHGYRIRWASWTDTESGLTGTNRKFPQQKGK